MRLLLIAVGIASCYAFQTPLSLRLPGASAIRSSSAVNVRMAATVNVNVQGVKTFVCEK